MAKIQINAELTISVEDGEYGQFVRLQRGHRWFTMSRGQWLKFQHYNEMLEAVAAGAKPQQFASILVSETKDVAVIAFKEQSYLSFHTVNKTKDRVFDNYINLSRAEVSSLMRELPRINGLLSYDVPDTLLPESEVKVREPRNYCHVYNDELKAIIVRKDGRTFETRLTSAQRDIIAAGNATVGQTRPCAYCGDKNGQCHCHRYDCSKCEPDNFCSRCQELTVYESKYSGL